MIRSHHVVIACAVIAFGLGALAAGPTVATAGVFPPANDSLPSPVERTSESISGIESELSKGNLPEEVLRDFRHLYPGVGDTELIAMWRTQAVRSTAIEELSAWPEFAGARYEPRDSTFYIYATNASAGKKMLSRIAVLDTNLPVSLVVVAKSYTELQQLFEQVAESLPIEGHYSLNIDVRRNAVVLAVADEMDADAARKRWPDEVIIEVEANLPSGIPAACTSRYNCGSPLRGGINIGIFNGVSSQSWCSTGFTATANNGAHWIWTAGHCILQDKVDANTAYGNGTVKIGGAKGTVQTATTDVAWVRNSFDYDVPPFGYVYAISAPITDVDYAISSAATVAQGDVVCFTARSYSAGDDACGVVYAQNLGGKPYVDGIKACGGDSGGAAYAIIGAQRWAYGLLSSTSERPYPGDCTGNGTGQAAFSSVPYINAYLDTAAPSPMRVDVR